MRKYLIFYIINESQCNYALKSRLVEFLTEENSGYCPKTVAYVYIWTHDSPLVIKQNIPELRWKYLDFVSLGKFTYGEDEKEKWGLLRYNNYWDLKFFS